MKNNRLIVVAGPTAVGKTELAVALAEHLRTEIVSADSRQLFRELQIGTAPPSAEQLARVKHHFIASHSVQQPYDAGQYGRDALQVIHQLMTKYRDVILCGGSGLYIKAVCDGFDELPEVAPALREEIVRQYKDKGLSWLQHAVADKDPVFFEEVDQQNPQRLMRALELIQSTGRTMKELRPNKKSQHAFSTVKLGLEVPREVLYERIDQRMDAMINSGLFEEAQSLSPLRHLNALQTVGYQEIFDYMEGKYDREEAVRLLKRNSRHYAKRQLTWFKRDAAIHWLDATDLTIALRAATEYLDQN